MKPSTPSESKVRQGCYEVREGSSSRLLFRIALPEGVGIYHRKVTMQITPAWSLIDSADLRDSIRLPGLLEMENLDLVTRKRIFAVAMGQCLFR